MSLEAAAQRGDALDHVLLAGPPGLGKTSLAQILAAELDVPFVMTAGPGAGAQGRRRRVPDRARAAVDLLRGRDPPAAARAGGDVLPGDGGRPAADHRRPGRGRARRDARAAAVHARRRDDARRPADDAAARPLRHPAPARLLRRARPCGDRAPQRRRSSRSSSTTTAPRRSRRARAARRASPTGCSSACATTPRSAPRASSPRRVADAALRAARDRRPRPRPPRPRDPRRDLREVRRRPGRPVDAGGHGRGGAGHDRGRLRALPAAVRPPQAHARAAASPRRTPSRTSASSRRPRPRRSSRRRAAGPGAGTTRLVGADVVAAGGEGERERLAVDGHAHRREADVDPHALALERQRRRERRLGGRRAGAVVDAQVRGLVGRRRAVTTTCLGAARAWRFAWPSSWPRSSSSASAGGVRRRRRRRRLRGRWRRGRRRGRRQDVRRVVAVVAAAAGADRRDRRGGADHEREQRQLRANSRPRPPALGGRSFSRSPGCASCTVGVAPHARRASAPMRSGCAPRASAQPRRRRSAAARASARARPAPPDRAAPAMRCAISRSPTGTGCCWGSPATPGV